MINSVFKKLVSISLALLLAMMNLAGSIANAQAYDITPPTINLDELTSGIAGETQIFTALVEDDISIKDVKLYYRYSGEQVFNDITMNTIGGSAYYTASLPTDPDETRVIEYYVQARDNGGNRVVRGFAFEPLTRTLQTPESIAEPPPQTATTEVAESGGFKWWYVALGVLAIGAAAGLAGGSSGGSGSEQIPFNIAVSPPE